MAFLNIPLKSIQVAVSSVTGIQTMPWYNPADFPVPPGSPTPTPINRDFRWRAVLDITQQNHSSTLTRAPGVYTGMDVSVGQWMANMTTGQAWQVISIESKTSSGIIAIVQDVYRYNTFRDTSRQGNGGPITGNYIVFSLSDEGLPQIDPIPPAGVSADFFANLTSRFEYINLQYDFPLYQPGNSFVVGDVIAASSIINGFVLADAANRMVIGRINSVSDTIPGWFTINPVQKVVDNLDYLPGDVGDIIYSDRSVPGGITTVPGGSELYIKVRNNTQSITTSVLQGPTFTGNVFQLNGVNVTVAAPGDMNALAASVNSVSSQTGVLAAVVLTQTSTETNNVDITTLYGEPLLWSANLPAQATINGVLVTFNRTSSDAGYSSYARPEQMAESINLANIPDITAVAVSATSLRITNIAGGPITIVNVTSDRNGVPFAGSNSGSGLTLSTPASSTNAVRFTAVDARAINFLDVVGNTVEAFGLISVENGVKACGLYIEGGLREANTTVVLDLSGLSALSPLIGDQAYVIDSDDGNGNNVGEWSMWLWDGVAWVETATQDSSQVDAKSIEIPINAFSPTLVELGKISTGRRVTLITVEVTTPFNGAATLDIGYQVSNPSTPPLVVAGLMPNTLIDLNNVNTYTTTTEVLFGTDTPQGDVRIYASFVNGGSTVGNAQIIVSYV